MNVRSATVGRWSLSVPTTWLEKTRVVRLKVGAYSTPFPASVREMAPPSDLLVPVRVAVRDRGAAGVRVGRGGSPGRGAGGGGGVVLALSVTVGVAPRVPVAAGVKVTLMVQVPLAGRVEGLTG